MFSWIALEDVVRGMNFLIHHPILSGSVNLCAPSPVSNRAFTRTLAKLLKRPAFCHLPAWLLKLSLGEVADATLLGNYHVSCELLETSGFTFSYKALKKALEPILSS